MFYSWSMFGVDRINMFRFILASLTVAVASAIVCTPDFCQGVKQQVLDCKGGVIKNGGFCGCTDICAKVENEPCQANFLLGVPNTDRCDDGLVCAPVTLEGFVQGHQCITQEKFLQQNQNGNPDDLAVSKKSVPHCNTACRRKSLQCTFSMVVYEGQWFAKCDVQGNFLAQQCDNTNHCFCVDQLTGEVQEGSKVLGAAQC
ncbi:uncharacterized protein LOC101852621 [Aplysia californica]|uniref:Uncharacterized protein LOC101852621 n=1 Tax=Aplysia californica TaxID=6500 RepID=A0ABM0JMN1_APLCA|nr:uncharacterized protein LOC101852621 [Aplysia californica]